MNLKPLLLLTIACAVCSNLLFAQQTLTPRPAQTLSDPAKVAALEARFNVTYQLQKNRVDSIVKTSNTPARIVSDNGTILEAQKVSATGQLIYYKTFNVGTGRTISTNKVWPGGSAGTALTGSGMNNRLGEWDGGGVRTSHQEFGGRVTQVDGAPALSDHATHVAGTMIAAGIDPNAKGMAYQANLRAFDWNNDEAEMTSAGGSGMLVSNHSYGTICAWNFNEGENRWEWWGDASISAVEDYKYGYYDDQAAEWDNIALANPFYLICKAAGNDRNNSHTGPHFVRNGNTWVQSSVPRNTVGPYDCIAGASTSKNILTVGAVRKIGNSNSNNGWTQVSDVVMSDFSGWGPTDDGRIKPDVVACGVNVYSSFSGNNTAYSTIDGTSMATPSVTGSLLLVQQHHNNVKGRFMRAATLKALAIHTADEAGTAGPDYANGWGLLNTAKAVATISDSASNFIMERTLNNGASYTQQVAAAGDKPIRVTISWADVAGNPVFPSLDNPTKMLVNDLDIRLTRVSDGFVFRPYVLNPASPASAATTGDNVLDNSEQIYLNAPQAGDYTLTVTHKGSLSGGSQAYSLIISGIIGRPFAAFSADKTSGCVSDSFQFTDNSSGSPSQRRWYFIGGNPSVSTAANPVVKFPAAGKYAVALKVSNVLGSDSIYIANYIQIGGLSLPFNETFEPTSETLSKWTVENPDGDTTWRLANTLGTTPGNTSVCIPFFNYNAVGQRDALITPTLSFKGYVGVSLTFRHAYTRFDGTATDSLIVSISNDCGATWKRISVKGENGGGSFATAPNNTYLLSNFFTPSGTSQWCSGGTGAACTFVGLGTYSGQENIRLKFESYNSFGNNLYLDNIIIQGTPIKPVAAFSASKTTVCQGDLVSFTDESQNFPNSWTWTFTGGDSLTSNQKNPVIGYSTLGTFAVKLRVSNISGADSITKTTYITVVPKPSVPNIAIDGDTQICSGDSALLSTDSAGTYKWYKDGNALSNTGNTMYASAAGSYRVALVSPQGCESVSSPIAITILPKAPMPTITTNLTGNIFCPGGTAVLTSSANAGNQWYKNGAPIGAATNKQFSTQDSGTYTVTVLLPGGCLSDTSLAKQLALHPKPNTGNMTGQDTVTSNQSYNYSVTQHAGSSYAWIITGGTKTAGGTTNSITVQWGSKGTGKIEVLETASTNCKGTLVSKNVEIGFPSGINEEELFRNVRLYPNPAQQFVSVSFELSSRQKTEIRIVNMLGQVVKQVSMIADGGANEKKIEINELKKGVYLVEVESGENKVVKRLMIQ